MMVVVFRAERTSEGVGEDYARWFTRMTEIACNMPGYISHKAYVAEDGQRLTLFEWESAETLQAWSTHPDHLAAKRRGRDAFYAKYHAQICEVVRESKFVRSDE